MKNIIPVASGKGGVGKSTISVNLAVALASAGHKVALVDADLYGPSIPTLMGGGKIEVDHEERLIPAEKFGVKYVSLAFFLPNPDEPVIWRGPMFTKALNQLFSDVNWGEVDYCIIDMPPGTGDAQISLCQMLQITAAIMVTTPQEVAMADVRKAINMFSKVNVPVLGIVENMLGFTAPNGETFYIFGENGGSELAQKFNLPLLASIPINPELRKGGDSGHPLAADSSSDTSKIFNALALKVSELTGKREASQAVKVINN